MDQDSLRPSREGFDVDTDVSSSDVVRIKVAYLDAVRISGQDSGRHPGLMILDAPRQQDIEPGDYANMLRYLSRSMEDGGQVIITSATPSAELDVLMTGITANVVDLGGARLLQPETSSDPLDGSSTGDSEVMET